MPVQYKDYYQTLGVSKTATQDEIRKAFRKLARQHHPDVAKDKKAAESKFKEINEAYEVLGDAEKRKQYDQLGADWQSGGPRGPRAGAGAGGAGGFAGFDPGEFTGTGFSDFFEQFFGGRAGRGRGKGGHGFFGQEAEARGSDIEADLMVTLEEALHGGRKTISFRRGDSPKAETYDVKIPKGVREGQRIRLAGQGAVGSRKELSGDLYLIVRLAQHPDYSVEGDDLNYELELFPWLAVLGTGVTVPTPDGPVRLKIPPGTQSGHKLRLRGRGMAKGAERGDFYVQIKLVIPKEISDEARVHWEALAKLAS